MKIDNRRLFTYPVLAEERNDYKTCRFTAELGISSDVASNIVFNFNFSTDCAEIKNLIIKGDAEYLFHLECPATIYREVFRSSIENFSCKIPRDRVKKEINCVGMIMLRRDIKNFQCADWNEDFGGINFNLPKGSVLAYKNLPTLKVNEDAHIFKNVASIFSIYKRIVEDKPFEIDLEQDKIKIGLSAKDYLLYRRHCSNPKMQPILNAMIILPALVYVFEELKADDDFEIYGRKAWFLSLKAAYRRKKINFVEHILKDENTSIKLAQEVMNLPLTKALENIALISEDAAEDF